MNALVRRGFMVLALLLLTIPASAQGTSPTLQGFSIVLVLGDVQDGATSDTIPAAARAALGDLKDFLPYRSYRVLDTAWVLASSATRQAVSSRLQGPDEQDFEVILDRMPVGPSTLQVRFEMREPDANAERRAAAADREAAIRAEIQQLISARAALENQLRRAEAAQNRGDADAFRQRLSENEIAIETRQRQGRAPSGATLIDTSFNMSLGETVVVGTSRMRGGNNALIVLLTAATRGAQPRE